MRNIKFPILSFVTSQNFIEIADMKSQKYCFFCVFVFEDLFNRILKQHNKSLKVIKLEV